MYGARCGKRPPTETRPITDSGQPEETARPEPHETRTILVAHRPGYGLPPKRIFGIKKPVKITDALIAEHVVFHTLFDTTETLLAEDRSLAEIRAVARLLADLLDRHSVAEHDLLLPSIDPYLEHLGQMKNFHKEDDVIVETLQRVSSSENLDEAKKLLKRAVQFSREHFDKEERIVFPLAEKNLKLESLERLGEEWANLKEVPRPSQRVVED